MRHIRVNIKNLKRLQFSRIKEIDYDTGDNTQVIIGSNGCGKTSLLNEIRCLVPSKNSYDNNGYRKNIIEHKGEIYTLISEFTGKHALHYFIKDDKNLNIGKTGAVQKELIEKYLGYTPSVQAIMSNSYKLSSMTSAERKVLFMKLNPFQIDFVLDKHKKVSSYTKSIKSNLTRLYKRKIEIEEGFLDKEELEKLVQEKSKLETDYKTLSDTLAVLKSLIEIEVNKPEKPDFNQIKRDMEEINKRCLEWGMISRKNPNTSYQLLSERLAVVNNNIKTHEEYITSLVTEIDQYSTEIKSYKELTANKVDQQIESLESAITSEDYVYDPLDTSIVSNNLLDQLSLDIKKIEILLYPFTYIETKFSSMKSIERRKISYASYRTEITYIRNTLESLNNEYISLKDEDFGITCQETSCPLLKAYKTSQESLFEKRSSLEKRITFLESRHRRLKNYLEATQVWLEEQDHLYMHYKELMNYLEQQNYLKRLTIDKHTLLSNPYKLVNDLKDLYYKSLKHHQLTSLYKELAELREKKRQQDAIDKTAYQYTQKFYKEKLIQHAKQLSKLKSLEKSKQKLLAEYQLIEEFIKFKELVERYQDNLSSYKESVYKYYEYFTGRRLYQYLTRVKEDTVSSIGIIANKLRNQENLQERYQHEVLDQIKIIEKEKKAYEELEQTLAELIKKYTIEFINILIETMNICLAQIFTYSISIKKVEDIDTFNYNLIALLDNDISAGSDISECSRSQREAIDFIFNIALIMHLDLKYPLLLDEEGQGFDEQHKQKLISFLKSLQEQDIISQLFIVNHDVVIHEGLANAKVLVLDDKNICIPTVYNQHVKIKKS